MKKKKNMFYVSDLDSVKIYKTFQAGTSILRRSYTANFSGFEETLVSLNKRHISGVRIANPTEVFSTLS